MDGTFWSGRSPSGWRTVRRARLRRAGPLVAVLALSVLTGCGGSPAAEVDGGATTPPVVGDSSNTSGSGPQSAAADGDDPAPDADLPAGPADADGQQAAGDDLPDPIEEIAWALTPAGPGSPSVNEDPIYKVLDDLDPDACRALLDPAAGFFEPGAFGTGERSVHLFRAAAHLCAGDLEEGEAAYRRALTFTWAGAFDQPLHSRVCNVWDAVTRMVDPGAGPCALEEFVPDDTTVGDTPGTTPADPGADPAVEDAVTEEVPPDVPGTDADAADPGSADVDAGDVGGPGAAGSEGVASGEAG